MELKVKLLNELAQMPVRQHPDDAGVDLVATSVERLAGQSHQYKYGFGIALEIPEGYVGLLMPRSSVYRTGMLMSNSVGVIDAGYRGEVGAIFTADIDSLPYEVGERAAQLLIVPIAVPVLKQVTELSETTRGNGGFGSTGK